MTFSSKIQLGVPSRNGGFAGLLIETSIPLRAIFFGCATAVAIVGIVKWAKKSAPPAELEKPAKLAVSRSAITN